MLSGRTFAGKKLPLTIAFAVLVAAAFGAGCKGFFQKNALASIAIQPPTPNVQVGQSSTLQAWGTYQDNTRSQITGGVVWTTSDPTAVQINANTGQITGEGSGGTATITAAAQGLSATANATSFLGNISNFELCQGTFDTGTCPAPTWTVTAAQGGGPQDYYVRASANGQTIDVTTNTTFTVSPSNFTFGGISCPSTTSPATCTVTAGTLPTGTYTVTVVYTSGSPSTRFTIILN